MDYNVFLLSRIREEYNRGAGPAESVVRAMSRVGRVILAAGTIMTASSSASPPTRTSWSRRSASGWRPRSRSTSLVVRMVVAPAVMTLLGERAWRLPRWLDRALPTIALEGELVEPVPEGA